MSSIGYRIRQARKGNGLRQKDLAEILMVSPPYISMIENDKEKPTNSFLKLLSHELNISYEWLLDGTGEMSSYEEVHSEFIKQRYFGETRIYDEFMDFMTKKPSYVCMDIDRIFTALLGIMKMPLDDEEKRDIILHSLSEIIIFFDMFIVQGYSRLDTSDKQAAELVEKDAEYCRKSYNSAIRSVKNALLYNNYG